MVCRRWGRQKPLGNFGKPVPQHPARLALPQIVAVLLPIPWLDWGCPQVWTRRLPTPVSLRATPSQLSRSLRAFPRRRRFGIVTRSDWNRSLDWDRISLVPQGSVHGGYRDEFVPMRLWRLRPRRKFVPSSPFVGPVRVRSPADAGSNSVRCERPSRMRVPVSNLWPIPNRGYQQVLCFLDALLVQS